jgi:transcriptional repressor NrdR
MRCPYCGFQDSRVIDSRDSEEGVRRRRECVSCGERFTTYERPQSMGLMVVKKDGRREEFTREKLLLGIRKACEKRPLAMGRLEALVDGIEVALYEQGLAEVSSRQIGEMAMEELRGLDQIAYIRFASVYRHFTDIDELKDELRMLEETPLRGGGEQPPLIPEEAFGPPAHPRSLRAFRRRGDKVRQAGRRGGPSHRLPIGRRDSLLRRPNGAAQDNNST